MIKNEQTIDDFLKLRAEVRKKGNKNKKYGFEFPLNFFLKTMYCFFTPQSYGTRIQNRLIIDYDLMSVPASEDKGDVVNKNNKYGELKCSFRDIEDKVHFVQIRPFQGCDFYLFTAIDSKDDYKEYNFCVLKKDIKNFLEKLKAHNCHGVKKNKKDNSREELRFSVKFNSEIWEYLVKNFLIDDIKTFLNEI
jgi:hypothetical protein